ncbi:MAG TPA: DUF4173 domain-containing protein [Gemmatimonadales bacterium]|nr:DUF4173 domain-containing protein [Gemmatimonadales bacterium]
MDRPSQLALVTVGAALALGVLGDIALRAAPWGISVPLCALGLTAAIVTLARAARREMPRAVMLLGAIFVLTSLGFAWRASETLLVLDVAALAGLLVLLAMRWHGVAPDAAGLLQYGQHTVDTVVHTGTGLPRLLARVPWSGLGTGRGRHLAQIGIGIVTAIPLLVLFGVLFADADPIFSDVMRRFVDVDPATVLSHVAATTWWAWLVGGFLWGLFLWRRERAPRTPPRPVLAPAAVITTLGLLAALFLAFVVVQLRFLFGGRDLVLSTIGLTYAEYARRGFFQLVTAAGLTLPILIAANAQVPADGDVRGRQSVRALSVLLLGLLAIVLASAVVRLRLYVAAYGLTEARFYAGAIMAWLVTTFVWFGFTVLRDRPARFAIGAIGAALVALAVLFTVDPPALVARHDLERAAAGQAFDAKYVASLGPDAVPALVAHLERLAPEDQCTVAGRLLDTAHKIDAYDWRSWSVATTRAAAALRRHRPGLETVTAACTT